MEQNESANEPSGEANAWAAFGYLVSGPVLYGGLGWLLDRWLTTSFLLPVGLIFGSLLGMYLVIAKYTRRD